MSKWTPPGVTRPDLGTAVIFVSSNGCGNAHTLENPEPFINFDATVVSTYDVARLLNRTGFSTVQTYDRRLTSEVS